MNKCQLKEEIAKFLNRANHNFTVRDVIALMAMIRTVMEIDSSKENWRLINFYCNWTLHSRLTQTNYGHTDWMFDLLAETFNSHWGNNSAILKGIEKSVGLDTLRNDLSAFFSSFFTEEEVPPEKTLVGLDFLETVVYIIVEREVCNKKSSNTYRAGKLDIKYPQSGLDVYISALQVTPHIVAEKKIAGLSVFLDPRPPKHLDDSAPFQIYQINKPDFAQSS